MVEIYKILLEIMEARKLSVANVSKLCDIPDSTVRGIIKREQKTVALDVAYKLSDGLNVSLEYLNGLPDKTPHSFSDAHPISEYKCIIQKYSALDPFGKETIDLALERESQRVQTITELRRQLANQGERTAPAKTESATIIELSPQLPDHCHLIKYFRDASAGSGIFILGNEVSSQISVSEADWDDRVDYVIRVNGDSMMPDYQDGDNVMVSQRVELHYGDVGIFVVNGKAYIKEYGQTELISRNPESPNVSIGEHDNIVCMGKVIGKLTGQYTIIND